jgi:hypothetical protein
MIADNNGFFFGGNTLRGFIVELHQITMSGIAVLFVELSK